MNDIDIEESYFFLGLIIGLFFGVGVTLATVPKQITTKTPLKPDIEILIKNGQSDTTYTYKPHS
jgi:hypothetical protein